jgi:hypothetical protein
LTSSSLIGILKDLSFNQTHGLEGILHRESARNITENKYLLKQVDSSSLLSPVKLSEDMTYSLFFQ